MKTSRWVLAMACSLLPCLAAAADGEGLKWREDSLPWARWQARLAISPPTLLWRSGLGELDSQGLKPRAISLMGDYVFARSLTEDGTASALRATSGLVIGSRPVLWIGQSGGSTGPFGLERRLFGDSSQEPGALPYLGIGYSGFTRRSGWSFSADFGLMALGAGNAVRLGRSGNYQGVDDLVRELRLTPVLQVGASYSF